MLREARQNAGLTLGRMAALTFTSKGYLSNIERGCRPATPAVIAAYERVLGEEMQRRTLLTGVAATVTATVITGDLLHHGFTSAMRGRPGEDAWLELVDRYGRDYMSIGADELQQRLAADLIVLQQQLETPALWAAAGRSLTVFGKTIKGAHQASRWYQLAAEAADRSEDTATRVWVRGRSALALGYEGAGLTTAERLASEALAIDDRPTLGSLNAHMALAHVYAIQGRPGDSNRHLDASKRAFDAAGSSEQISDFAVPEWRYWTFTSMLLSRLGDPRAVEAQDMADLTRPATLPRFATHIQLHRGLMIAKAGDRAAGVAFARAAMEALPPERHSLSLRLMLAEVERV